MTKAEEFWKDVAKEWFLSWNNMLEIMKFVIKIFPLDLIAEIFNFMNIWKDYSSPDLVNCQNF